MIEHLDVAHSGVSLPEKMKAIAWPLLRIHWNLGLNVQAFGSTMSAFVLWSRLIIRSTNCNSSDWEQKLSSECTVPSGNSGHSSPVSPICCNIFCKELHKEGHRLCIFLFGLASHLKEYSQRGHWVLQTVLNSVRTLFAGDHLFVLLFPRTTHIISARLSICPSIPACDWDKGIISIGRKHARLKIYTIHRVNLHVPDTRGDVG